MRFPFPSSNRISRVPTISATFHKGLRSHARHCECMQRTPGVLKRSWWTVDKMNVQFAWRVRGWNWVRKFEWRVPGFLVKGVAHDHRRGVWMMRGQEAPKGRRKSSNAHNTQSVSNKKWKWECCERKKNPEKYISHMERYTITRRNFFPLGLKLIAIPFTKLRDVTTKLHCLVRLYENLIQTEFIQWTTDN